MCMGRIKNNFIPTMTNVLKELPNKGFLKFKQNQLEYVRKLRNLEDPKIISEAIDVLRSWLQKQEYFNRKDFPDFYFEKLLIDCKGSVERAKVRLKNICTLRTVWPDFFISNGVRSFIEDFKIYNSLPLPDVTEEGLRVSLTKVFAYDTMPADILMRFTKYAVIMYEYAMIHDYQSGFIIILDFRDVNMFDILAYATRNFSQLQQCVTVLKDGYGMRTPGIHFITSSKATDAILNFAKLVLVKKVANRVHVHTNIETLYAHVPQKILPADLGGSSAPLRELMKAYLEELGSKEHEEYLKQSRQSTIDMSKKPIDKDINIMDDYGIPGSFRKLSVD